MESMAPREVEVAAGVVGIGGIYATLSVGGRTPSTPTTHENTHLTQ